MIILIYQNRCSRGRCWYRPIGQLHILSVYRALEAAWWLCSVEESLRTMGFDKTCTLGHELAEAFLILANGKAVEIDNGISRRTK